jgi:hypothetical protein
MTIEQKGVIDFIAIDAEHDVANLVACDHLVWDDDELNDHLITIQEKINEYLSFIESGNLFEAKPELRHLRLVLKVVGQYPPPPQARQFYAAMQQELARNGYPFIFEHVTAPLEDIATPRDKNSNTNGKLGR